MPRTPRKSRGLIVSRAAPSHFETQLFSMLRVTWLLNSSPIAAITAPSANLPPPATDAVPPTTAEIARPATRFCVGRIGPTAAPAAAESAPGPHLPPDATAAPHPTAA